MNKSKADKNSKMLILSELIRNEIPEAYFSHPGKFKDPEKKREVTEVILSLIKNAKFKIKVYAYSLNHPEILDELENAKKRGVEIRITGDPENSYKEIKEKNFPIYRWAGNGIHHIKIIYVDDTYFFTGTGNFSEFGLEKDWNGYIKWKIPQSQKISLEEFLEEKRKEPSLEFSGISLINSPLHGIFSQEKLLEEVNSASISIEYLIFDHFDQVLTAALKEASRRGVNVNGVYNSPVDEEGNTLASDFYGLGSEIYRDGNFDTVETDSFPEGGLLHHKTMIIDGRKVLSGSYNYSISARSKNREILYWTELPHIVSAFREEFQRIKGSSYRVVPKNFHIKKEESVSILSENFICGKNKLNSPTLEIGSGIWKSYLYYKYPTGTDCISLENFEDISNGIASFKRNKLMENQYFLSNKIYVSGRNSNFTWTNPETQNSFKNYLNPGPGKLETLLFSPSSLILRDSENLLDWKEALLYFPSRGISNYTTQVNQNSIRIESKFDSTQKSQGMIFLSNGKTSKVYCFLSKGEKLDNSIQYFINKIYLSSKEKELLKCYNL